jgi:hypothetical protein
LEKNYKILPLKIIDGIINELSPSENSRELGKKIHALPLRITNGITD